MNESAAIAGLLSIVVLAFSILHDDKLCLRERITLASGGLALMFGSFLQL